MAARIWGMLVFLVIAVAGCEVKSRPGSIPQSDASRPPVASTKQATADAESAAKPADGKKVEVGRNVVFEVLPGGRRRVLVHAKVCLREGQLEQLMCRERTKEHEAILSADMDARDIHKALLLTGAEPGGTVSYEPAYKPAHGAKIKVSLNYQKDGQSITIDAKRWVRSIKTQTDLEHDWVFAGSQLFPNRLDKNQPPYYAANDGDVICVSNFGSALLDLPINSPKDNADLAFEANTERIPPLETKVLVLLEPVLRSLPAKKAK